MKNIVHFLLIIGLYAASCAWAADSSKSDEKTEKTQDTSAVSYYGLEAEQPDPEVELETTIIIRGDQLRDQPERRRLTLTLMFAPSSFSGVLGHRFRDPIILPIPAPAPDTTTEHVQGDQIPR